jgi:hypothetical protein
MVDSALTYDALLATGPWRTFSGLSLASGNNLVRGTVMARNSSTGKLVPYNSGGSNNTNVFYGILVGDTDASLADVTHVPVYTQGGFKSGGLTFGTSGDSVTEAFRDQARQYGCYLDTAVSV